MVQDEEVELHVEQAAEIEAGEEVQDEEVGLNVEQAAEIEAEEQEAEAEQLNADLQEDNHVEQEAEIEEEEQDADVEDNEEQEEMEDEHDADVEDNDQQVEGEPYLDQHRQPRRGDVVSFREGGEEGHWVEAKVTSACTGRWRYYYNVVTEDTGERYGIWLKPPQITTSGHQEAWHLGRRQDFMRSPVRPPSRRVSFGSIARDESREEASFLDLSLAERIQLVSETASGDRC